MMLVVVALLSFIFSLSILFLVRIYLAGNRLLTGDTFFHLLTIESIKRGRWKYPSSLQNVTFIYDVKPYNYLAYPPLFHYIVAIFPAKSYLLITKIFNLVICSVLSSFAAVLTYNATINFALALFTSFIVIFNLSTFETIVAFNSRPLGVLFYSLVFYVAITYPPNVFTIVITFLIMLINLTHKFATQAVIFGLVPYCLIFNKLNFLIPIMLGFLLSLIVSRGFYLDILKEHFYWLYYYSFFPDKARIITKLKRIFSRNFWYLALVLFIALLFISESSSSPYGHLATNVTFWAFIPLLPALVASISRLSFLGEAYRYVHYGVVPVGVAISLYVVNSNIHLCLLLSFLCIFVSFLALLKWKKYLNDSMTLVDQDDILSYNSLKSYRINNLLVFPHTRTLEVNYFTNLHVIHPVRPKGNQLPEHIQRLIKFYKIQHILKFKGHDDENFASIKNVVKLEKILESTNYEVYKLVENIA
jgi:hypothetical protein